MLLRIQEIDLTEDITKIMNEIALNARIANEKLAIASSEEKNDALNIMAEQIENNAKHIPVSYTHLTLPTILLV